MGDDITIGVTEIVNTIEVTAQPNDQIVDISIIDNADDVTLNITPTVIEINVNKSAATSWGQITGTLSDQTDLSSALALKANLVGGKVPASELPSYVDDIVEVANYASLPSTGETGKIYVTLDNNKIYRWSGSVYIEIASNNAVWGAITGTLSSQTDLQSALNAKQNSLSGTGFVKISGSTISYDNSTYVPTSRTITINGTAYDLSADRSWTISSGTWGSITGTLSSQTDLQTALNAKANTSDVVDLSSNQVIQGVKEFNLVRPTLGLNLSLRISDISTTEDNGMIRLYDNTIFNDVFVLESDGTVFAKSFIKKDGTSSQYLMADGSVSTGGGVSGSGTTNYIPKFTGSTAIGNSLIYDNGTNIGIGTASPTYKLDINGTFRTKENSLLGENTTVGNSSFAWGFPGANYGQMQNVSSTVYGIGFGSTPTTIGTTVLSYNTSGNVGIGTTSPAAKLSVSGGNISLGAGYKLQYSSTAYMTPENNVSGAEIATGGILTIKTGGTTPTVVVNASGNVGIGTTSPDTKLQVAGTITSINGSNGRFNIGSLTNYLYGDSSSNIILGNSGGDRLTITSGGNVGIGTTSPEVKLDVRGSLLVDAFNTGNENGIFFRAGFATSSKYNVSILAYDHQGGGSSPDGISINGYDGVSICTGSNSRNERMRVTEGGNVGIGNTSPSTKLDVTGAITASGGFFNSDMRLKDLIDYNYNVSDIKPITYFWKDGRDNKKHVGYSAQEVKKVMPDAVNEGTDGMLSVNYVEVLVAKIAELENRIKQLEK